MKETGRSYGEQQTAALRFLFVKTFRRAYMLEQIPFPKAPLRLPTVVSQQDATRLIDSAGNLRYRTILMTLYSTGMRVGELVQLKAAISTPIACSSTSARAGKTRPQRAAQP